MQVFMILLNIAYNMQNMQNNMHDMQNMQMLFPICKICTAHFADVLVAGQPGRAARVYCTPSHFAQPPTALVSPKWSSCSWPLPPGLRV